jgi:uncharacterized protein
MLLNPEISSKLPEIKELCKKYKVSKLYVFGSVLTDKFKPESDIDFLIKLDEKLDPVEYGDNYFLILDSLRNLLKRDVDLITEKSLKNPYFINIINTTKKIIYE